MQNAKCKIVEVAFQEEVGTGCFRMELIGEGLSGRPGQFFHILCDKGDFSYKIHNLPTNTLSLENKPILRRPFSIHRLREGGIEILYKVKGIGTRMLSFLKKGDTLSLLGPCGQGFRIQETPSILVGGGMGVAPIFALAESLKSSSVTCLIGAKTGNELLMTKEFQSLGINTEMATDDGSCGKKGTVLDLLLSYYTTSATVYACGPIPMLSSIIKFAKENKASCQVLMEERMGCGMGGCLCCALPTKAGYKKVCKDGPVFEAEEL
ncbi:dihydroorotate dehydrogenase electron transfer subunit [bacterium]|nr:dihydroorotate dehydrogenase electron transfer subunit [bacterium]